ncbi:MAG: radical SAM protein [Victivallales bacterium]|jgi:radical SAM domain protein
MTDLVLINPGDRKQVFQGLGFEAAAIEPPFWIAVIAAYLRSKGYSVAVIDANAENLAPEETAARTAAYAPLAAAVIVYGSQPSASTQNMPSAGAICRSLKRAGISNVILGGLHPSALPARTLQEEACDYVADGEAVQTLETLLGQLKENRFLPEKIGGFWWRDGAELRHTDRYPLIRDLDSFLPVAAWDLLPMHLYRAHNWHCFDDIRHRQPYGAIYTSLGCPFRCSFCCINAPFGEHTIRYRSPERVLEEIDLLVTRYGVKNLKIVDELFILNKRHYMPIVNGIIERGYDLNIWVYARVDTIDYDVLPLLKKAGINWFALGIESANPLVRDEVTKNMHRDDILSVVRRIQSAGIRVIGNYIFGLPSDTFETMRETLALAKELNCEYANMYSVMAYPGSRLYEETAAGHPERLPRSWSAYSQHSRDCYPLANDNLTAAEILRFRDEAFVEYNANPVYLKSLECTFGPEVAAYVRKTNSTGLIRNLTEESCCPH